MRLKLLYTISLLLSFITLVAYSQDYYWYNGAKLHLQTGNKWYILYEEDNNFDIGTQNVVFS